MATKAAGKSEVKEETKVVKSPLKLGEAVLIRTVTYFYTGRIVILTDSEIVLAEAAWIADTGRFSAALTTGNLNEVEPMPHGVSIARAAVVDVSPWPHALPIGVK